MKNIYKIIFLFSLLLLVNCGEDEYADYTAPDKLSDVSWIISIDRFALDPYSINADSFMSFMDLSVGAVSHEWTIDEGNAYLNTGFKLNDSLEKFVDKSKGLIVSDEKIHVLFRNSGINKVRLFNKFDRPVSYKSSKGTLNAVKQDDFWVIDTTFKFDVYANIKPAFRILKDGVEILKVTEDDMPSLDDESTWPTVEVEAGGALTYEDLTTVGRANARSWTIPDGSPTVTNGISAIVKFFKLGTFNAGTIKSSRITPLPVYAAEKLIPLKVKVIPSTQPFKLNGFIKEDVNEIISFQVTGEVAPFSGQEGKFTVKVKNTAKGFDQTIAVQNAKVSSTNATIIELKLAAPIYNSDEITIAYSGGGISSTDTRPLEMFATTKVQMYFKRNVLTANSWASYETENAGNLATAFAGPPGTFFVGAPLNGSAADPIWSRTTEKAFEGAASMKFSVDGVKSNYQLHTYGLGTIDMIPAGTYKVSFMVYLEAGNTMSGFWTWGGEVPELAPEAWDVSVLPRGQWVKVEHIVTLVAITAKKKVSIVINPPSNPNAATGRQTMYLDDFSLIEFEARP